MIINYKDPKAVLDVCGKATEGPWRAYELEYPWEEDEKPEEQAYDVKGLNSVEWGDYSLFSKPDADFIALARTALPYWVMRCMEAEAILKTFKIKLLGNKSNLTEMQKILQNIRECFSRINDLSNWTCTYCGFLNLHRHEVCERCGQERQG
jgi:rubrerythrin